MAIEEISESKRKQIIKKSVDPLPNNPSKAGYKADEIKKAMFGFVTDEKDSIIAEINRIINEINFNFDNIDLSDYDTKEEVRNLIKDFITNNTNELENYYTKKQVEASLATNADLSKKYTDTKVAELIDSAPETLDTFKEIADAFKENDAVLDALNSAIGNKADKTALATTDAKVSALETDNATNKADIKELQENKADADDIPTNYVTTDTIQEITGLKSFNEVQIKGTLIDDAGTRFNSLYEIQPRLTAGRGISIEGNEISSTAEDVTVKDQYGVALRPYTGGGANPTENKDALTERAIATALPYINGRHDYTQSNEIYAPTSSGKTGQILVANSSSVMFGDWAEITSGGTPEWKDISELGLPTITIRRWS